MSYQTITMNEPTLAPMTPSSASLRVQAQLEEIARSVVRSETDLLSTAMVRRLDETISRLQLTMMQEISKVERPLPQVLAVKINDYSIAKLSAPAPVWLYDAIGYIKTGNNVCLVGPKGCGKTFGAKLVAEALRSEIPGLSFNAITITGGLSETALFGRFLPNGEIQKAVFWESFKNGGLMLIDELGAADENMASSMLTILAAKPGDPVTNPYTQEVATKHPNFIVMGADNTFLKGGDHLYTARNKQDAALVERFFFIEVNYDTAIEKVLCPDNTLRKLLQDARTKLTKAHAPETISTRKIEQCYRLRAQLGWSYSKIASSLTKGWQEELIEQCGLDEKSVNDFEPKPEKAENDSLQAELAKAQAENDSLKKRKAFASKVNS